MGTELRGVPRDFGCFLVIAIFAEAQARVGVLSVYCKRSGATCTNKIFVKQSCHAQICVCDDTFCHMLVVVFALYDLSIFIESCSALLAYSSLRLFDHGTGHFFSFALLLTVLVIRPLVYPSF